MIPLLLAALSTTAPSACSPELPSSLAAVVLSTHGEPGPRWLIFLDDEGAWVLGAVRGKEFCRLDAGDWLLLSAEISVRPAR